MVSANGFKYDNIINAPTHAEKIIISNDSGRSGFDLGTFWTIIRHNFIGFWRCCDFFIQNSITAKDRKRELCRAHFARLKDVFQSWINYSPSQLQNGSISFEQLDIPIVDELRRLSNNRYQQITLHFRDGAYDVVNTILNELCERCNKHNGKLDSFDGTMRSNIRQAILGVDTSFYPCEDRAIEQSECYNCSGIVDYFFRVFNGYDPALHISDGKLTTTNSIFIAKGDEKILACVSTVIKEMSDSIKTEISDLVKEQNAIINKYDNDFKNELSQLITRIEDEGVLSGKCNLTYCKPKEN